MSYLREINRVTLSHHEVRLAGLQEQSSRAPLTLLRVTPFARSEVAQRRSLREIARRRHRSNRVRRGLLETRRKPVVVVGEIRDRHAPDLAGLKPELRQ